MVTALVLPEKLARVLLKICGLAANVVLLSLIKEVFSVNDVQRRRLDMALGLRVNVYFESWREGLESRKVIRTISYPFSSNLKVLLEDGEVVEVPNVSFLRVMPTQITL